MRFLKTLGLLAGLMTGAAFAAEVALPDGLYARFTTPHGVFVAELYPEQAPLPVVSFTGLAEGTLGPPAGRPYYTGLKWYRVVPGFVMQSGNPHFPEEGDPAYEFPDTFAPGLHHDGIGVLSMANAGPDTNGGEFFLTLGDCTRLNYLHSVFGRVVRGLDILPRITADDPFNVKILRIGATAKAFVADETRLQALSAATKKYAGTTEPGPAAHFDDPDHLLPLEPPRAMYFNFKLANYERTTGLKIVARLSATPPPAAEDEVPGAYMKHLAEQLGVARTGVLVSYFAPDDWRVWFGDEVVARFLGRPVVPGDLAEGAALHDAKETLIDTALAKGDAAFAAQQNSAPAGEAPAAAQHLKLQVDALLDALLLRLEPRS